MKVFNTHALSEDDYTGILSVLRNGGVIGFPTDTSYGLAADPFNENAVSRIFEIKSRIETNPILVLVDSLEMAESITKADERFRATAERFWPGPLTMIVKGSPALPSNLTAGTGTVGVRWPLAPFATSLIRRFGRPVTATSANKSGMPSAVSAEEVRAQLGDLLEVLVDGGVLPYREGSTLLDLKADPPVLLRDGPISYDVLQEFFHGRIERRVAC